MRKNPKIILLGETNVGKTSLIQVLLHGSFQDRMANTLGACFHKYVMTDAQGHQYSMDLWDTAGQEKFRSLLTLYYKNSEAVVIVFDITSPESFKTVDYWARQIDANCDHAPYVMLVGNKTDAREQGKGVNGNTAREYAKKKGWGYEQCSAKENHNVKQVFQSVAIQIRKQEKYKIKLAQSSKMKISNQSLRKGSKNTSCC